MERDGVAVVVLALFLGSFAQEGWQISKKTKKYIKISKKLNHNLEGNWENFDFDNYWKSDSSFSGNAFTKNFFGYNQWKKQSVFENKYILSMKMQIKIHHDIIQVYSP